MREILFRGKRIDNGEWVYGIPVPITINCYDKGVEIIEEDGIEYDELDYFHPLFSSERVIPKSVSQFTGLIDKNGKKIFEGDIVDIEYNVDYVGIAAERKGLFVVVFDNGCFMKKKINGGGMYHFIGSDVCRVVGNATDNPKLLRPSLKPEYRDGDPDCPICPNCRTPLKETEDCDCGQKIDWSDAE